MDSLDRRTKIVAGVVVLGVIMSILDTTIVNVARDTLWRDLHSPLSTIQWVATGYLLALAVVIPLAGRHLGRAVGDELDLRLLRVLGGNRRGDPDVGDRVSAKVTVLGTAVTVSLANETTGKAVKKTLRMSNPDTSNAEWIAEAPSTATSGPRDEILPLANFGTVDFSKASATAGGNIGSVADWHWMAEQVDLGSPREVFRGPGPGYAGPPPPDNLPRDDASAVASPSALTKNGSSFTVSRHAAGGAGRAG